MILVQTDIMALIVSLVRYVFTVNVIQWNFYVIVMLVGLALNARIVMNIFGVMNVCPV